MRLVLSVAGSGPFQKDAEQTCLVWDLAAALWGRLKEEEKEEEEEGNHLEDIHSKTDQRRI